MTLLISVISAVVTTIIWYLKDCGNQMKLGTLSLMYWGCITYVDGRRHI